MPMTISIDDDLKKEFAEVCKEIGLPPSTAFGIFARAVVRERAIPFELSAVSTRERAANAYDQVVATGIERGLRQFREGDYFTRDESREMRKSKPVIA